MGVDEAGDNSPHRNVKIVEKCAKAFLCMIHRVPDCFHMDLGAMCTRERMALQVLLPTLHQMTYKIQTQNLTGGHLLHLVAMQVGQADRSAVLPMNR